MRVGTVFILFMIFSMPAHAAQKRIVALGDSLTAGYGLQNGEDFASALGHALVTEGLDVKIDNAGVSGDTTAGGRARLDWAIQGEPKPDLVIVALGANDMLRGVDPATARENLKDILETLKDKDIPVFLIGMKTPINMGVKYKKRFDAIYADLAREYDTAYYPFFLEGVAMKQELNLPDGIHPNTKGIAVIVKNIAPLVKGALGH